MLTVYAANEGRLTVNFTSYDMHEGDAFVVLNAEGDQIGAGPTTLITDEPVIQLVFIAGVTPLWNDEGSKLGVTARVSLTPAISLNTLTATRTLTATATATSTRTPSPTPAPPVFLSIIFAAPAGRLLFPANFTRAVIQNLTSGVARSLLIPESAVRVESLVDASYRSNATQRRLAIAPPKPPGSAGVIATMALIRSVLMESKNLTSALSSVGSVEGAALALLTAGIAAGALDSLGEDLGYAPGELRRALTVWAPGNSPTPTSSPTPSAFPGAPLLLVPVASDSSGNLTAIILGSIFAGALISYFLLKLLRAASPAGSKIAPLFEEMQEEMRLEAKKMLEQRREKLAAEKSAKDLEAGFGQEITNPGAPVVGPVVQYPKTPQRGAVNWQRSVELTRPPPFTETEGLFDPTVQPPLSPAHADALSRSAVLSIRERAGRDSLDELVASMPKEAPPQLNAASPRRAAPVAAQAPPEVAPLQLSNEAAPASSEAAPAPSEAAPAPSDAAPASSEFEAAPAPSDAAPAPSEAAPVPSENAVNDENIDNEGDSPPLSEADKPVVISADSFAPPVSWSVGRSPVAVAYAEEEVTEMETRSSAVRLDAAPVRRPFISPAATTVLREGRTVSVIKMPKSVKPPNYWGDAGT